MRATLIQEGEITVVKVSGRLDINQSFPFRQVCLEELSEKKVVFNLSELSFVGSTGIQSFFQIIEDLHQRDDQKIKVVGLHSDFHRLVSLRPEFKIPCYKNFEDAKVSFEQHVPSLVLYEEEVVAPENGATFSVVSGEMVKDSSESRSDN